MPSSGVAGSYDRFIPSFVRNLHTVFHNGCISSQLLPPTVPFSPTVYSLQLQLLPPTVPFSPHPLQNLLLVDFFDDGHTDWCEVTPHCTFDLHVSNN